MPEMTKKRLRVLYVDYSLGFGGAIKSLALTLRRLPEVEALAVTSQDRNIIDTWLPSQRVWSFRRVLNYTSAGRIQTWAEARLPAPLAWLIHKGVAAADLLVTATNVLRLGWLIRRQRVDIVHLNNGFVPPEALVATRILRVPCIVHLRGFHDDYHPSTLRNMRHIDRVVAVSGAVAEDLIDGTPVPEDRITVIHDPVDLERAVNDACERERVRARHGLEPHQIAVGIFGRIIEWKGQEVFVEAAIRAMREDSRLCAFIVGDESDGTREYADSIRVAVRDSGMEDRFIFTGYTPDVEAYYAAMDVVVHASITPEPFGMVVPEAMALGRAVIAADAGGPREVVTHGHDGLLVPPGDVDALAAAMLRLAADPAERERLAANAYRTAHTRFGIETNANAVRAVYEAVLHGQDHRTGPEPVAHATSEAQ